MGADWGSNFAAAAASDMAAYEEILVPRVFNPFADVLLDAVGVAAGLDVLDVACGPGTVSRRAAERVGPSGRVTGCDQSPAMLEVAAAKPTLQDAAPITYRCCSADALDVPDDAFDLAFCQQGLQFFPDRVAALTEIRRALKPGGRAGVAVWCPLEESPAFDAMARGLDEVLGKEVGDAYRGGPFGLTDPEELTGLFADAGFTDVRIARHAVAVEFEGGPAQLASSLAVASIGPQVAALDPGGKAALVDAIAAALGPYLVDGSARSETASHIVVAAP